MIRSSSTLRQASALSPPNRDTREIAIEAANVLKSANPHSKVVVRDRQTDEVIEATFAPLPPCLGR